MTMERERTILCKNDHLQFGLCMSGVIKTYQKCPACGAKFPTSKGEVPILCGNGCQTQPTKFFIRIKWKGKVYDIYHDRSGRAMLAWQHAYRVITGIRAEIDGRVFDPGFYCKKAGTNFEVFWTKFLERYKGSTRDKIKAIGGNHLEPFFRYDIKEIRAFHIDDWWNQLRDKGLSPKYMNDCLQWLKRFFNIAHKLEIIERVPNFPDPAVVPKKKINWLTQDEQQAVYDKLPDEDKPIFDFLFLTGCRVMEAAGLQRADIDLRKGIIAIQHTINRHGKLGPTKSRNNRPIPITEDIRRCLARAINNLSGYVFVNKWGRHYSYEYIRSAWHEACKNAGVEPIQLKNATRHSFGMRLISQGVDMWRVSKAMGHSSERMTENYVSMLPEDMKEFYQKIIGEPTKDKWEVKE